LKRRRGSRTCLGRTGSTVCRSAAGRGVAPRHGGMGKLVFHAIWGGTPIRQPRAAYPARVPVLPAQAKAPDQRLVAGLALALQVVEQTPPPPDQHQQAAPRMEILRVDLEMLGQVVDPLGEQGDLHFRAAGVGGSGLV